MNSSVYYVFCSTSFCISLAAAWKPIRPRLVFCIGFQISERLSLLETWR